MSEQVIIVDQHDRQVAVAEKLRAHQQALCHRAFSVFIFDTRTEAEKVLLQQRHVDKYHCGGLWTNACCGHPRPGEVTRLAAERRLHEEMGITIALTEAGVFHYHAEFTNGLSENEIDYVFIGEYTDETLKPHPQEIMQVKWIELSYLQDDIYNNGQRYTPWFAQALQIASASKREKNSESSSHQ